MTPDEIIELREASVSDIITKLAANKNDHKNFFDFNDPKLTDELIAKFREATEPKIEWSWRGVRYWWNRIWNKSDQVVDDRPRTAP